MKFVFFCFFNLAVMRLKWHGKCTIIIVLDSSYITSFPSCPLTKSLSGKLPSIAGLNNSLKVKRVNEGISRLCSSRARLPVAPNSRSQVTRKSLLFHRNHMLGTLDFTSSGHWLPSIFLRAQPWILFKCCTTLLLI